MSPSTAWEALKAYLRGQIISYNAQKTEIVSQLATAPSADCIKECLLLQKEFDLLTIQKAENLLIRSHHTYYEHGDKTGRILAYQLCQRAANQAIPKIWDESGIVCLDHLAINSRFVRFYCNLYTSESLRDDQLIKSFLQNIEIPHINTAAAAELESPFSIGEIEMAIRSMQCGKSPGPDGYPTEFFRKFSNKLAPILNSVYNESLSVGSLPETL